MGDHKFILRCIFFASAMYLGLILYINYVYLEADFFYGDAIYYHKSAIMIIKAYFQNGVFLISKEMAGLNYAGYPAYFMAPIYLILGEFPIIIKFFQILLCLHISIRIYDITALVTGYYRIARMAFLFAIFFPEMIVLCQYILKDILVLWCIVNILYYATYIRVKGLKIYKVFLLMFFWIYLYFVKTPVFVATFFSTLYYISDKFKKKSPVIGFISLTLAIVLVNKFFGAEQVKNIEGFMQAEYYGGTAFSGAKSIGDVFTRTLSNPLQIGIYFIKVFQGVFAIGVAAIRDMFSAQFAGDYRFGGIILGIGALWRFANLPVTIFGLWIILKRYRSGFSHILMLTLIFMLVFLIIGYGTRWGLPGMVLCSISWGVGFDAMLKKNRERTKKNVFVHYQDRSKIFLE